jgi:tetratricopeptide (TPR) repeat protein
MTMPTWSLRLLGAFELSKEGEAINDLGPPGAEQLLARLAIDSPTAVTRNAAAADMYPDVDLTKARIKLSSHLFNLRQQLAQIGAPDLVRDVPRSLFVDPAVEVDVAVFGRCLASVAVSSSAVERTIYLDRAVTMYGGGLLPGRTYPWLAPHQERFAALYRDAASLLASTAYEDPTMREMVSRLPLTAWQLGTDAAPSIGESVRSRAPIGPVLSGDALVQPTLDRAELQSFAAEAEAGLESTDRQLWTQRVAAREREIEIAVRQALDDQDYAAAFAIAVPLWRFWYLRNRPGAGRAWMETLLVHADHVPVNARVRALHAAGTLAYYEGKRHTARSYLEQALGLRLRQGNLEGTLRTLANLAIALYGLDELQRAHDVYQQCISAAQQLDKPVVLATVLLNAALCEIRRGDPVTARELLERRLAMLDETQRTTAAAATTLANLAAVDLMEERLEEADERAQAACELSRALRDDRGLALALRLLGRVAQRRGDVAGAIQLMQEGAQVARRSGNRWEHGSALGYLARALEADGRDCEAAATILHATSLLRAVGDEAAVRRMQQEIIGTTDRGGGAPPAVVGL